MNIKIVCALNVYALNARFPHKYLYCEGSQLSAAANEIIAQATILIVNVYVHTSIYVCWRMLVMSKERAYFKRCCVL